MTKLDSDQQQARQVPQAGGWTGLMILAIVAALVLGCLAIVAGTRAAGPVGGTRLSLPLVQPYPPPASPSPTDVPLGDPFPIPTHIPHQVVSLATAPDAAILSSIQQELDTRSAEALAARLTSIEDSYCYYGSCQQCGIGSSMESVLAAFFGAGSLPRIEGYFRHYDASQAQHRIYVIVSGWAGPVALPTTGPEPFCDEWSTRPSLWTLRKNPLDPAAPWHWLSWEPIGPYEDALARLSEDYGYGTYYVIRP